MDYTLYLCLGAIAGLLGGLFGIGGGVIIVPILIIAFDWQGVPQDVAAHMAVATSLATIVLTSIPSIYTHAQKGSVRWDLVAWISPGIILGTLGGGVFALSLSGVGLQLMLGAFFILVALQMLFYGPQAGVRGEPGKPLILIAGSGIGSISALFGIGGGSLTIPFLSYFGIPMHHVVGTAAASGLPIALSATLFYGSASSQSGNLPEASLGYIFIPAWLGIVVASVPSARLGALLAHRLDGRRLRQLFSCLLVAIGVRFIWINLTGG
ncbi:sulfite exporter TauE/SafE family protein [Porticoccaceae bacterium]|nr:sulfite exporter TauE/SafE family protein [Porticoccaceae bacterium]